MPERLIALVMALYSNAKSRVRILAGTSDEFGIGVGVHQRSALSPLLFVLVIQEATKEARGEELNQEEAVRKFCVWKREMETRG